VTKTLFDILSVLLRGCPRADGGASPWLPSHNAGGRPFHPEFASIRNRSLRGRPAARATG
jgi:hypothetical protein